MSLTTNISSYWKLDENTGTTSADATGGGNTATLQSSPTWVTGKINSGISFNGTSNYLSTATNNGNASTLTSYTQSMWFKTTSYGIMAEMSSSQTAGGAAFDRALGLNSSGKPFAYIYDGASVLLASTGSAYNDGNWHLLVVTCAGSSTLTIYVDGSSVASTSITGNPYTGYSSSYWLLGRGENGAGSSYSSRDFFNGSLDEIGIWSRALTSTEVSQLYNGGSGLQYPFSGGSTASLFRRPLLNGLGSGGPFFNNPLGRSMLPKLVTA